jgi:hypothetical protein
VEQVLPRQPAVAQAVLGGPGRGGIGGGLTALLDALPQPLAQAGPVRVLGDDGRAGQEDRHPGDPAIRKIHGLPFLRRPVGLASMDGAAIHADRLQSAGLRSPQPTHPRATSTSPCHGKGDAGGHGDGSGIDGENISAPCRRHEQRPHHRRTGDQAQIARQVEQSGEEPTAGGIGTGHERSVVGRLKERIAGRDEHQGHQVAGKALAGRQRCQGEGPSAMTCNRQG